MKYWLPYVIGTTIFMYIHSYNRNARMYLESGRTLSWNEFFTKVTTI